MQKAKVGTVGTDIFCHYMPSNVKSGVLLINPNTGIKIDHELQDFYFDAFTIVVRSATITKTMEKANKIMSMFPVTERRVDRFGNVWVHPKSDLILHFHGRWQKEDLFTDYQCRDTVK